MQSQCLPERVKRIYFTGFGVNDSCDKLNNFDSLWYEVLGIFHSIDRILICVDHLYERNDTFDGVCQNVQGFNLNGSDHVKNSEYFQSRSSNDYCSFHFDSEKSDMN